MEGGFKSLSPSRVFFCYFIFWLFPSPFGEAAGRGAAVSVGARVGVGAGVAGGGQGAAEEGAKAEEAGAEGPSRGVGL